MLFLVAKNYITSADMWFHAFWGYGKPYKNIAMYEKAWAVLRWYVENAVTHYARGHNNSERWTEVLEIVEDNYGRDKLSGLTYFNFRDGDLHFCLGHVNLKTSITYIPTVNERRVYFYVKVTDKYDFTKFMSYDDPSFGSYANDFGHLLSIIKFIQEYDWYFTQSGSIVF